MFGGTQQMLQLCSEPPQQTLKCRPSQPFYYFSCCKDAVMKTSPLSFIGTFMWFILIDLMCYKVMLKVMFFNHMIYERQSTVSSLGHNFKFKAQLFRIINFGLFISSTCPNWWIIIDVMYIFLQPQMSL